MKENKQAMLRKYFLNGFITELQKVNMGLRENKSSLINMEVDKDFTLISYEIGELNENIATVNELIFDLNTFLKG